MKRTYAILALVATLGSAASAVDLDDAVLSLTGDDLAAVTDLTSLNQKGSATFTFVLSGDGVNYLNSLIGQTPDLNLTRTFVSLTANGHTIGTDSGYTSGGTTAITAPAICASQTTAASGTVHSGTYYDAIYFGSSLPLDANSSVAVTVSYQYNEGTHLTLSTENDGVIASTSLSTTSLRWSGWNTTTGAWQSLNVNTDYVSSVYLFNGFATDTEAAALNASVLTPAVPEPATATLSLLALAGLAARRRRK